MGRGQGECENLESHKTGDAKSEFETCVKNSQ